MKKIGKILMIIFGALLFGAGFWMLRSLPDPGGVLAALPYLCIGVGCGMFGHALGEMLSAAAVRRDPQIKKQIEIESKDERNIMLGNMAKAKGFDIMTYLFAALMLAYALMGESLRVIIPFVIAYLFVEGYSIFCRVKMDKEF